MKTIHIDLNPGCRQIFAYKICGYKILTNKQLLELSAFSIEADKDVKQFTTIDVPPSGNKEVLFKGTSWLAWQNREITCSRINGGYVIDVPKMASFFVDDRGSSINLIPNDQCLPKASDRELEYLLFGPPLMLVLALNRHFSLHASSVGFANKAILFTGDSGFGKSTIARCLQNGANLNRLSDDISVLSESEPDLVLNADFPQLKLEDHDQYFDGPPIQLGAVILIDRHQQNSINIVKLNTINAIQVLVNHSVATQLFDKLLVKQHLQFMANLVSTIPIYKLSYPNGLENMPAIEKILKREFD